MDRLIEKIIPESWYSTGVIEGNYNTNREWLEHLWIYLRRQHPDDLRPFLDLPLLPMDGNKVVPLTLPSQVVLRSEFGIELSPGLCRCLELAGVTVVERLVDYVHCHAAVVGSFVRLPLPEDVVDVLLTVSQKNDVVTALRDQTTGEEKLELLALIGKLNRDAIGVKHRTFLRTLPIFKSTRSTPEQPEFVSAADVNTAHSSRCTVALMEAFIDVSTKEAMAAATNLELVILNEINFIKGHVLSEIRNRHMTPVDVQTCMRYVFDNIQMLQHADPKLLQHFTDIPFITTKGGPVVSPSSVYDPTDGTLQKLFVGEDNHFPSGFYDSPESLIILRKMGMKTARDVSAHDILYTAAQVEDMGSSTSSDDARKKAEELLTFLTSESHLLQEEVNGKMLVDWLRDLTWVPVCTGMPEQFPLDLKFDAADVFHAAGDVKSYDWVCVVGSVVPIVRCRSSENISKLFGWDRPPSLGDAVRQFTQLVATYSHDTTADYIALVRITYSFLSMHTVGAVQDALTVAGLREWVWHGEGFTTVERALLRPPALPLKPYVYTIPAGLKKFHRLLCGCGVRQLCSSDVLVEVLHNMKAKYDTDASEQASDGNIGVAQPSTDDEGLTGMNDNAPSNGHTAEEIDSDLRLGIDILNHMASLQLSTSVLDQVLVPTDAEGVVCLLPASDCTYCDVEWLRKGFDSMEFDETDGIVLIHHHLPTSTAAALGVATLMSRMLHAEELAITSFGQGEPLTNTLRRMLEDYTDGLAIPKELVQNADDAGATEVRFMYDERTNGDARKYLFDRGMQECQGSALWCYSNSLFTDGDLDNIIQLGGAAKQIDATKIGRFGLGFNVVYNLTDVPSFVTGNVIVFFDPHTTHLGHSIHNKSKPGIKIDLRRNKTLLRKLSHQFQPYRGVFGCDMDAASETSWPGTLFRFPLRTKLQAQRSEISGVHYDNAHVAQLLTLLADNAQSLLLFTQNVKKLSLWHLSPDTAPEDAVNIFSVSTETVTTIRCMYPHDDVMPEKIDSDSFLKAVVRHMQQLNENSPTESPLSSTIVKVESYLDDGTTILQTRPAVLIKYWLCCLCMAEGRALELAQEMKMEGYVPAMAVAIRVMPADSGYVPTTPVGDDHDGGQVFASLPLPVRSGLPVHVNAMFAVHSNRRCLVERSADDTGSKLHAWNEALLEDGVVVAYTQMLDDLLTVVPPAGQDVPFHHIWPTTADTQPYFQPMVRHFYHYLATHADTTPVFYNAEQATVVTLDSVVFLHSELVESVQLQHLVTSVFKQCMARRTPVNVGGAVLQSFLEAGCGAFVDANTYNMKRFFDEIFFPNIHLLGAVERDLLVRFALLSKKVDSLLTQYPCVPVTPEGTLLRSPQDLVHPDGEVASLYLPADSRFPHGDIFTDETCLRYLQRLGMPLGDITWDNLVERLESVEKLYEEDTAMGQKRISCACRFVGRNLTHRSGVLGKTGKKAELQQMTDVAAQEKITRIPFLPLLPRPRNFPIAWKNDEYDHQVLLPPCDLYPFKDRNLMSAVHPIGNSLDMTKEVQLFVGLVDKPVSCDVVLTQFEHLLILQPSSLDDAEYDSLRSACFSIYSYMQSKCRDEDVADLIQSALSHRPSILIHRHFHPPHKVAFGRGSDSEPYLHRLPTEMARWYEPLMVILGVRQHFETADYVGAMQELKEHAGDAELTKPQVHLAITLATQLGSCMQREKRSIGDVQEKDGVIYVPNTRGVLHSVGDLCFNDCPSARTGLPVTNCTMEKDADRPGSNNTHAMLPYGVAEHLGIRTKKQETLRKHAWGIAFGQKENLTTSLRRVLQSYPFNHEILKELIQNADDAGATEIHFVSDSRYHNDEAIFSPSWKPLQGPALCVYNNRPFTVEDLEGIQKLGMGSKLQDSTKTGQYGIGFSSAYHLTDVPSVLTRPPGKSKSLCVFDPHLRFVPGSTRLEPGMRYDVNELFELFPDVFSCYLPQCFDIDNGTMFRFPLRTSEMAERSDISKQPVTVQKLRSLFEQLRKETCRMLLFTNHIKTISISEVDHNTGKLNNTYTAHAKLSDEHLKLKSHLADSIRTAVDGDRLHGIPRCEVISTMAISDTDGAMEKWCVSEQLGTEPDVAVPESVSRAIRAGELHLVPRGGVACRLDARCTSTQPNSVFCFLPLPIKTSLPVHINGHFALGYENRRRLWDKADIDSYKTEWNEFLCREVIAPCYVRLLTVVRSELFHSSVDENSCTVVNCSRRQLDHSIAAHQLLFPSFDDRLPEWDILVKAVYASCALTDAPLFPTVSQHVTTDRDVGEWHVTWLPVIGDGVQKAFFTKPEEVPEDKPSPTVSFVGMFKSMFAQKGPPKSPEKTDTEILRETIRECGLKVLEASPTLTANLQRAHVPVEFLSSGTVMSFFTSYSSDSPSCQLGTLPAPLTESPFKNLKTLQIVLKYCAQDPDFVSQLDGAPLLLTADDVLRVFDSDTPVYHSDFQDLSVNCKHLFLHQTMSQCIFSDIGPTDTPVLSSFTIDGLVKLLNDELPADKLCNTGCHVEWNVQDSSLPPEEWLIRVWQFLNSQTNDAFDHQHTSDDEGEETGRITLADSVAEILQPLNDWCLIPARTPARRYLVPISMASTVIDFHDIPQALYPLRAVLRKLHLPELDILQISKSDSITVGQKPDGLKSDILRALVTTVNKPRMVLSVVHALIAHHTVALSTDERHCLLAYFNDHVQLLQSDPAGNMDRLKDLPVYTTVCDDVIQLTGNVAYTLPLRVPTNGMDVWRNRSGIVFLWQDRTLQMLYAAIGCAPITLCDVYCEFIFQHIEYLSRDDRITHLHYIYNTYMETQSGDILDTDRTRVVSMLRELAIINASPGDDMRPVSDFYDPDNTVFRSMLPADSFPPTEPPGVFTRQQWRDFLDQLGLQHEFTPDMYMQFVRNVAQEGAVSVGDEATNRKSKQLVQHLFDMTDTTSQDQIMHSVADVAFVPEAKIDASLQKLHPQSAAPNRYIAFRHSVPVENAAIAWTQANLLPQWAVPDGINCGDRPHCAYVKQCLGIADIPPIHMVAMHLRTLCEDATSGDNDVKQNVVRGIYSHLQDHGLRDPDMREILSRSPCVLVEDGSFVFANQTVINMYDTDEIRPYLYKIPPRLVEFRDLLQVMGATERVTADQYGRVLNPMYVQTRGCRLNPNEMRPTLKAMAGLLAVLKDQGCPPDVPLMYLLSEAGTLVQSTRLVFNDAPAYYERAGELPGLQFLARVLECRNSSMQESLNRLPTALQPVMLSSIVREQLPGECKLLQTPTGPAARLNAHLHSHVFHAAIDRLARHEAHRLGIEPDTVRIVDATSRLSMIRVHGVIGDVVTELVYRDEPLVGSRLKKTCFVEKPRQLDHGAQWHVYVSSDTDLSLDLLVSLADVINDIMSGLLRHAVLYLLPILRCQSDDEINIKLNSLNVRDDNVTTLPLAATLRRPSLMPVPGDRVSESDQKCLKSGQTRFSVGDYVGYRNDDTQPYLHGIIEKHHRSTWDGCVYMVNIGDNSSVIAHSSQLYTYMRN